MDELTEQASAKKRIRRNAELPESIKREAAMRYRYPHQMEITAGGSSIHARYRRTRFRRLVEGTSSVLRREIFCWLSVGRKRVGALDFVEFEFDAFAPTEELWNCMDSYAAADASLAGVLFDMWSDPADYSVYGPILDFRTAWMAPGQPPGVWASVAKQIIATCCSDYSIIVLKAFPLEYEGRAPKGSRVQFRLRRRQRAMQRYYARVLQMKQLPGRHGKDGWMWRPHAAKESLIPPPVYREWQPEWN